MPTRTPRSLLALSVTGLLLGTVAAPATASASATGPETFTGLIVTSGATGERQILASPVVAKGVFTGAGRIVEVDNLPGDPDNVQRDDLVFRQGAFHLVSEAVDTQFSFDPATCRFTATVQQIGHIVGGTGAFTQASGTFTGSVRATGVAASNPDGTCRDDVAPIREHDVVTGTGTLTY